MDDRVSAIAKAIESGCLQQQMVGEVSSHPVIHFSQHAEKVLSEGFVFGEPSVHKLDYTYNNSGANTHHSKPGYNFAFSAIDWNIENDCLDFEVNGDNSWRAMEGMYASKALLFNVDGLYTRHYDEFHQVIFWGMDASLEHAVLLEEAGHVEIDGEPLEDDFGNPVSGWTSKTAKGDWIVAKSDQLPLRQCVAYTLQFLEQQQILSGLAIAEYREVFAEELPCCQEESPTNPVVGRASTSGPVLAPHDYS